MSYNNGVYNRLDDYTADKSVTAARVDAEFDDIATALSTCILKDGTQTVTDDIAFNNKRITTLGAPSSAQEIATKGYVDDNTALVLLADGEVSAITTLDLLLTGFTAYRGIRIQLSNWVSAIDDVDLLMRFSSNGGSSFDSGASDYTQNYFGIWTGGLPLSGSDDAEDAIFLAASAGNSAGANFTASIDLLGQTASGLYSKCLLHTTFIDVDGGGQFFMGGAVRPLAQDTDALRFFYSTGNIASGSWAIYGYR